MKSMIPNALTALNLVFGMIGIMYASQGDFKVAAWWIIAAMVADGTDGRAARYFGVSSEFGKELDSLCDLVSFGVAPAFMAYMFFLRDMGWVGAAIAIFFAVCGAMRLARFNVNTSVVKGFFMGLPIPAAGCAVATFIAIGVKPWSWLFAAIILIFGYLMVSTVKYPDFKGKGEEIKVIPAFAAVAIGIAVLFWNVNSYLFVPFLVFAVFGMLNNLF